MPYTVISKGQPVNPQEFIKAAEKALMQAAFLVQKELSTPPPKKPGQKHHTGPEPGGFYTPRQRKYMMGGIRRGTIRLPYLRTGNLPRSWSVSRLRQDAQGLYVLVYSDPTQAPYAKRVQQDDLSDPDARVRMHDDWSGVEETKAKLDAEVVKTIQTSLKEQGFV